MARYLSYEGTIIQIENTWSNNRQTEGCNLMVSVVNANGDMVNFIVSPGTYVLNHQMLEVGDTVVGFYDSTAPVPLIFPPQYQAMAIARNPRNQFIVLDFFNSQLLNSDNTLQLNIGPNTQVILPNGQRFLGNPARRNLLVVYSASTRSLPAQTTPSQVVVMCI